MERQINNKDFNSKAFYREITMCKAGINSFFIELSVSMELLQIFTDLSKSRAVVPAPEKPVYTELVSGEC